jgi:hypothetical protein
MYSWSSEHKYSHSFFGKFFHPKGGYKSEDTGEFLILQKKIFQITILSRKLEFAAQNSKQLIQIFCSGL